MERALPGDSKSHGSHFNSVKQPSDQKEWEQTASLTPAPKNTAEHHQSNLLPITFTSLQGLAPAALPVQSPKPSLPPRTHNA